MPRVNLGNTAGKREKHKGEGLGEHPRAELVRLELVAPKRHAVGALVAREDGVDYIRPVARQWGDEVHEAVVDR
jgi:hypothetical protein